MHKKIISIALLLSAMLFIAFQVHAEPEKIPKSGTIAASDNYGLKSISVNSGGGFYDSTDCYNSGVSTGLFGFGKFQDTKKAILGIWQFYCQGKCGDANHDGLVNVSDAVYIINYVFVGGPPPKPVLACGDANDDCFVNVSDAVYIINYVFVGGPPPQDCCSGKCNWEGDIIEEGAVSGDCCPFP
jgi:hypothetical protein